MASIQDDAEVPTRKISDQLGHSKVSMTQVRAGRWLTDRQAADLALHAPVPGAQGRAVRCGDLRTRRRARGVIYLCRAGRDRTGLVTLLPLALAGVADLDAEDLLRNAGVTTRDIESVRRHLG